VLTEAVDSVLDQSYGDFELLVVDDGSTDDTVGRLARYGDDICLIHQEHRGASAARNVGIGRARGRYICFLDSDDLWLQNKLQAQMDLVTRDPQVKICYTEEIWIRRGVRVNPRKKHRKYSGWILEKMLPLCIVSPSSVLIDREVFDQVGLFDESLPACEDYDLWLRVAARFPVLFIPQQLIAKRGGDHEQLSQSSWGNDRYRVAALEKILQSSVLTPELRELTIQELHRKCRVLINGYHKRGKEAEAEHYQEIAERYSW